MRKSYRVKWEIDIYASTAREAAKVAIRIQLDPDSTATYFDVTEDVHIISDETNVKWVPVDLSIKERGE